MSIGQTFEFPGFLGRKPKILLMDDEEDFGSSIRGVLERIGCEAGFARDGAEAIRLYKQTRESGKPFDIVILDLMIPGGMGGKETIKELLKIDPQGKAIVSSGQHGDPAMVHPEKYGFSAALPKPYTIGELKNTLHKIIAKNG